MTRWPSSRRPGGTAEIIGIAIAAVVLLITFGSLVAAGLPLLTAIIGVGIGISTITRAGRALGLSTTTATLAMMIGLAVGIDYALFIVSRYREERAEGRDARGGGRAGRRHRRLGGRLRRAHRRHRAGRPRRSSASRC